MDLQTAVLTDRILKGYMGGHFVTVSDADGFLSALKKEAIKRKVVIAALPTPSGYAVSLRTGTRPVLISAKMFTL